MTVDVCFYDEDVGYDVDQFYDGNCPPVDCVSGTDVCFYDEPVCYDVDQFYDGNCAPEIVPVEFLFRGRSLDRLERPRNFLDITIDLQFCIINGKFHKGPDVCERKTLTFKGETDDDLNIYVDNVRVRENDVLVDVDYLGPTLSPLDVQGMMIRTQPSSIKVFSEVRLDAKPDDIMVEAEFDSLFTERAHGKRKI